MSVQFSGKYVRESAENYDAFLSKMCVPYLMRKAMTSSTPTTEVIHRGGGKFKHGLYHTWAWRGGQGELPRGDFGLTKNS